MLLAMPRPPREARVWIAGVSLRGPWLLSIDHLGVVAEVSDLPPSPVAGPGTATFIFDNLTQLHGALDRVYKLAVSLPDAPLIASTPRPRASRAPPRPSAWWSSALGRTCSGMP